MIQSAVKNRPTFEKMMPFMDTILYETIIPLMIVPARDQQLFCDDPIEYIRKQTDLMENIYQQRASTVDLLQLICDYKSSKKKKD